LDEKKKEEEKKEEEKKQQPNLFKVKRDGKKGARK